MNLTPEQKKAILATNPELASIIVRQETNDILKTVLNVVESKRKVLNEIKGVQGDKGDKGDKGDRGDKGEKGDIGPQGPRGERGEKGERGDRGERGFAGRDGLDGMNGKDGKDGKDGEDAVLDEAIFESIVEKKVLDGMAEVDGRIKAIDQRWRGGGLSKVYHDGTLAGSGTSSDPLVVVGGNNSGFQRPLSGILGQGTFTWATAPNVIVVDNVPRQKTQSDGTVNWTGTTTTVLSVWPNYDIFASA